MPSRGRRSKVEAGGRRLAANCRLERPTARALRAGGHSFQGIQNQRRPVVGHQVKDLPAWLRFFGLVWVIVTRKRPQQLRGGSSGRGHDTKRAADGQHPTHGRPRTKKTSRPAVVTKTAHGTNTGRQRLRKLTIPSRRGWCGTQQAHRGSFVITKSARDQPRRSWRSRATLVTLISYWLELKSYISEWPFGMLVRTVFSSPGEPSVKVISPLGATWFSVM
jgi:hypothetical protein